MNPSDVVSAICALIMGLIWNDIRGIRSEVRAEMKEIREQHADCQAKLPERFAPRDEVGKIHGRIDDLAGGLRYVEGRLNGKPKGA